jgi:ribosomal protein S18 acetylase RimI-like enzyme
VKTRQHTSIRRARPGEAGALAELIARAFDPLEMTRWLVPNDIDRIPVMTGFLHLTVEHAIAHGTVDVIGDLLGGAVWLPSTAPDLDDYEQRLKAACGVYTERFQALDTAMHATHPTTPHEYLPFIAVHPNLQTCGLGSALLDHHHTTLDPRGIPAYLEAASPDSARLYRRHGYQSINNVFGPAGSKARLRPMWRRPGAPIKEQRREERTCDE